VLSILFSKRGVFLSDFRLFRRLECVGAALGLVFHCAGDCGVRATDREAGGEGVCHYCVLRRYVNPALPCRAVKAVVCAFFNSLTLATTSFVALW
jgi:hypothetical protein